MKIENSRSKSFVWFRAAVVLEIFLVAAGAPALAPDMATFRGNLQHTGVYEGSGAPKLSSIKWKFHTDGKIYSSPAVAQGKVFFGSTDGSVYAVDDESGKLSWRFKTEGRITSSPAIAGGLVYFESYDGNFYAVDAANGTLKWKFATGGERRFAAKHIHGIDPPEEMMPDPFDFYLSSPAVWDGKVYFGSGDGNIYGLDAATGSLVWKFKTGDVVHASPAIANGILFIGSWDTYFYALDARTGKERWRFKTGEDPKIHNQIGIQSSAAVAEGIVYFGCRDSNLYALDATTGAKRWAYDNKGSWVIGSPAVEGGRIYFATSDSGLFHIVDAKSGADVASMSFKWPMFSSPSIAANHAYIGSHEGKLFAIDLGTRQVSGVFQTDASVQNGPALTTKDGGPKYEAAMPSNFYDDIVAGVQKMFSVGAILSSPVIVNDTVYFGSADGYLYAVR
ncbi:MAG TPA: PQQ-binding-like beta-propeller repeat protein [Candidatus Acidoferrum sp.]|nr:PQQ-binding-like beta-propeller repeat protein [Candidatus Acidoferrum sp.]